MGKTIIIANGNGDYRNGYLISTICIEFAWSFTIIHVTILPNHGRL